MPEIILIDGGQLQLEAALTIFAKMLHKQPIILSIVKGSKRVRATETILSKEGIIEMPKDSSGFILLQQVRDEAHRFAIKNNRKKKRASIKKSKLDDIPGIGPAKKKLILQRLKSIYNIKQSSLQDLANIPGIGLKLAELIKRALA